jgi:hypothetical protein
VIVSPLGLVAAAMISKRIRATVITTMIMMVRFSLKTTSLIDCQKGNTLHYIMQ